MSRLKTIEDMRAMNLVGAIGDTMHHHACGKDFRILTRQIVLEHKQKRERVLTCLIPGSKLKELTLRLSSRLNSVLFAKSSELPRYLALRRETKRENSRGINSLTYFVIDKNDKT